MSGTTENILDAAIGAARDLRPEATEDEQAEFAARLVALLPARISAEVVQIRRSSRSWDWVTVPDLDAAGVPGLNRAYGWPKYRIVEMGVCP